MSEINGINGMILLIAVLAVTIVICLIIWGFFRPRKETTRDTMYIKIILNHIQPYNQGTSIDEVMNNLRGVDMSGFHLNFKTNKGGSTS